VTVPGDRLRVPRRRAALYFALAVAVAVVVVFALDSVYGFLGGSGPSSAAQRTATVAYGTVQSSVSASGNVSVATSAAANFAASGTLGSLNVRVGDFVKAGQVLARLDPTAAEAALETSKASLAQAQNNLATAKAGPTASQQASNASSLQQSQAQVSSAQAQLASDRSTLAAAEKQLQTDRALGCPPAGSTSSVSSTGTSSNGTPAAASQSSSPSSLSSSSSASSATSPSASTSSSTSAGASSGSQPGSTQGATQSSAVATSARNGVMIRADATTPTSAAGSAGSSGTTKPSTRTAAASTTKSAAATTTTAAGPAAPAQSAPSATTGQPSSVGAQTATLTGTVDPLGTATTYRFEYGTSASSLDRKTPETSAGSASAVVSVSSELTGLEPGRSYVYRLVATNGAGTTTGADQSFTTMAAAKPAVTTGTASSVLTATATLNGTVDPNGSATTYFFEYGPTSSYGSRTAVVDAGSGSAAEQVSAPVTGLEPGTSYLFRLVAKNASGTSTGVGQIVKTAASSCVEDEAAIVAAKQTVAEQEQAVATAEANLAQTKATIAASETPSQTTIVQYQAAVTQAEANVAADQKALDETALYAPVAGTVTAVNGAVGDTVGGSGSSVSRGVQNASSSSSSAGLGTDTGSTSGAGSSASSGFITIDSLRRLEVVSGFAEADATKLAVGQPATVTFPALPNVEAAGKVVAVSNTSTVVSNVVTYDATVRLVNPPADVKDGMTANVGVVVDTRSHALLLPSSAISTSGAFSTVQLLQSGKTTVTRVLTGLVGDSSTQIVSGLQAGDIVVVPTVSISSGSATTTTGGFGGGGGGFFGGGGFAGGGGGFAGRGG
jgi:multidrug efflux pump subunit AcrA (membrane-fusion protein)